MVWGIRSIAQYLYFPYHFLSEKESFLFSANFLSLCCNCSFIFCTFLPHLLHKLHLFFIPFLPSIHRFEKTHKMTWSPSKTKDGYSSPSGRSPEIFMHNRRRPWLGAGKSRSLCHLGWMLMVRITSYITLRRFPHILNFILSSLKWE